MLLFQPQLLPPLCLRKQNAAPNDHFLLYPRSSPCGDFPVVAFLQTYNQSMQAYSRINSLLLSPESSFGQFHKEMLALRVEKETYLNLFLTTAAITRSLSSEFPQYVELLTNFRAITGRKSADINYVGYKDRISVLMHACSHGNIDSINYLLRIRGINLRATDPRGRTALSYAADNKNQGQACAIVESLLDSDPALVDCASDDGVTVLMEVAEGGKYALAELLLRRGADPNMQRKDSEQTLGHRMVRRYKQNKEAVIRTILLLLRHKANFNLSDKEGKNVFQAARAMGLDLSECAREGDCEEDKESLTTLNQMTKMGDNGSQLQEIQSNFCSQRVNFSEFDLQDFQDDELRSIQGSKREEDEENSQNCPQSQDQAQEQALTPPKSIDFALLSQQIIDFSMACEQRQRNLWICLSPFLASLQKIASKNQLLLQVVGSFATGLWSTFSDIDINLIPAENEYRNFETALQRIYRSLKSRKAELGISDLIFTRGKVNSIKLGLSEKFGSLVVDISIFYRNNQNRAYVTYILQTLAAYPQVKPLFLMLKKVCETFDLHDHLFGGLKTYTLFLMIASITRNLPNQSPGELLNQIALYYGFYYEYGWDLECPVSSSSQVGVPRAVFNFIDPLNPKNNVGGKSTKVEQVQNMFRSLYLAMNQLEEGPYLHQLFQLHSLF